MTSRSCRKWIMSCQYAVRLVFILLLLSVPIKPTGLEVSQRIFDYFRSFIDSNIITEIYEENTYRSKLDTHALGEYVGQITGKEFDRARTALRNIHNRAVKSYKKHKWNKKMKLHYWDGFTDPMISNNGTLIRLNHLERYSAAVSLTESSINIPTDVYDNWTEVRNTIQWTQGLDKAFIENNDKHSDTIFWQYIGTPEGVMRTYPATNIPATEQIEFDVRRRPWYNAGIGCPKDVIMLIDTSGSLEGFPSRLLRTTAIKFVKEIISDTDFVTAIDVGHEAEFMTCYHHLTRANKIVKKKLLTAIEEINANGTSNWDDAFKVAFKTFETSRAINQTTGCEKAIVIFTDETGQPVDEMVAALNSKKEVRVFVFSFRRNEGLYSDRLKRLACTNRGHYSKILYFGQIEAALQRLVQIGNAPLKDREVQPTWSNAYKDLGGFGLVITVTLPVVVGTTSSERYVAKIANNNSVSLLGIVGLDFKASRIIEISSTVLPISTSSMILNNKGYPVYHPKIDKYRHEDVNTKLHNFQWTDDNIEDIILLERKMIDQDHSIVKTKGFLLYENQKRGTEWYQDLVYQIYPVDSTPFSIACIYPTYPPTYLKYYRSTLDIARINSIIAYTWKDGLLNNFQENSCRISDVLAKGRGLYMLEERNVCSAVTFSILTDIFLSKDFRKAFKWPDRRNKEEVVIDGKTFARNEVMSHFIITYTGLVFFSNPKWISANSTRTSILPSYAQTVKNITGAALFISHPFRRELFNFRSVNLTQRVNVTLSGVMTQVAAVGVELRVELVRERLLGGFSDKYERFLVDENGEALMGFPTDVSGHMGELYPFLFRKLIDNNVFSVVNYTECINLCPETVSEQQHAHGSASGPFYFKPILYNLITGIFNFLTNFKLYFVFDYLFLEDHSIHALSHTVVECCKMFRLFQRNFEFQETDLYLEGRSSDCLSRYKISWVPDTNVLLVVDMEPSCRVYSDILSPYSGKRVNSHHGCREDEKKTSNVEVLNKKETKDHAEYAMSDSIMYYRNQKTCILSFDDEGMCSSSDLLLASLFLIFSVLNIL